jgi:hypothetical protein
MNNPSSNDAVNRSEVVFMEAGVERVEVPNRRNLAWDTEPLSGDANLCPSAYPLVETGQLSWRNLKVNCPLYPHSKRLRQELVLGRCKKRN